MTEERDGKSRRTGQPDLLASLPDERPPASQPAPGNDPASIEELVTGVRDLREQVAGLREAQAAPKDDAAAAHIGRIEEAAAKAAAAAERIDGGLESTADRVTAEVGAAATRIEAGFRITRDHVDRKSRLVHRAVEELRTRVAGRRFGFGTVLVGLIVFVLGMLLESRIHILYNWL